MPIFRTNRWLRVDFSLTSDIWCDFVIERHKLDHVLYEMRKDWSMCWDIL